MSTLQKSCNNNRIEGLIWKKNALKRADSYLKSSTILSGDSSDTISNTLYFMAYALAFDLLQVKRAVVIGPTYVIYWPITGTVAVAITFAKECQHQSRIGL
jgi:hypothetical protein